MKARLLGMALLATLTLAACGDDNNEPQPQARVRAVHLSPDAPAVDVLVDGNQVLSNVAYLSASDYLAVRAGARNLTVEPVGSDVAVIDLDATLDADADYTVFAVNTVGAIEPLAVRDDNTAPAAGQARVRVLHAAPSVGAVDVYFAPQGGAFGQPSLVNLPFKGLSELNGSNYVSVPAGDYTVRVTPTGVPGTVAIQQDLTIPAGAVVTAVAVEGAGGGAPFAIQTYVDSAD